MASHKIIDKVKNAFAKRRQLAFDLAFEHDNEFVGIYKGISFINDAKAVNIENTLQSLQSYSANLVLMIGGNDSTVDYNKFNRQYWINIKAIVYMGFNPNGIMNAFGKYNIPVKSIINMNEAVREAYKLAQTNDLVIYSPACNSFGDMEEHLQQGVLFKKVVTSLIEE